MRRAALFRIVTCVPRAVPQRYAYRRADAPSISQRPRVPILRLMNDTSTGRPQRYFEVPIYLRVVSAHRRYNYDYHGHLRATRRTVQRTQ